MIPALTHSGPCDILFFEAIPGGPLDCFDGLPNVEAQLARTKDMVRRLFRGKRIASRTPPRRTRMPAWSDGLRRRSAMGLDESGARVLGLADTIALADPIVGQGANNAIKSAWIYSTPSTAGVPHLSTRPG